MALKGQDSPKHTSQEFCDQIASALGMRVTWNQILGNTMSIALETQIKLMMEGEIHCSQEWLLTKEQV